MAILAKQKPMDTLAALLGVPDFHGKPLNDSAFDGFPSVAGDMSPADEMDNLSDNLDLHPAHKVFGNDNRFGKRGGVLRLVARHLGLHASHPPELSDYFSAIVNTLICDLYLRATAT